MTPDHFRRMRVLYGHVRVSGRMRVLYGHVRVSGQVPRRERGANESGGLRTLKLHEVTPRGLYVAKRQER